MNKVLEHTSESDMLDEYDFSRGIRGKYSDRYEQKSDSLNSNTTNPPIFQNTQEDYTSNLRWNSKKIKKYIGNLETIKDFIPVFVKKPFKIGASENKYSDMVINVSSENIPVGVVSKKYSLVQHSDILYSIKIALANLGYNIDETKCEIYLTEHGECMWLKIQFLQAYTFDPGDGYPLILQLNVLNSVDRSTPLEFKFGWYRLICENGFLSLNTSKTLRKKHTASLASENLAKYLNKYISDTLLEEETYRLWKQKSVNLDTDIQVLENWTDTEISKKWGDNLAERARNILITAKDGKIKRFKYFNLTNKQHSYRIKIFSEFDVPGAQPVENMYDVANALSWLSSHQNSLQIQYKMMRQVPEMLKKLEKLLE
ncbi:MAG: DUF932 domain-containing protein [Candidatus Poribacteria bacterium]|nr:DUF932 domain-containing protein [Candidatus Poribacteria bacterium]